MADAGHSTMPISCDAMPNPFRRLVIEQAVTSAPEDCRRYQSFLGNPGDCISGGGPSERFAIGETIQRKTEAAMPFYIAIEGSGGALNSCSSKGWIENHGLNIPGDGQRPMNVRFNVVVEPKVESEFVRLSKGNERANIAHGKITRGQMAIGIAKRSSGVDVRRQAKMA